MRKLMVLCVMAIVALISVNACANPDVSVSFVSKYLVGKGNVVHDHPCLQLNVFVPIRSGLYANLWTSSGIDGKPNYGREVDYTLGYSEDYWEVGGSLFDLNEIFGTKSPDIFDPFAEIRYSFLLDSVSGITLKPYVRFEYMLTTRNARDLSAATYAIGTKANVDFGSIGLNAEVKGLYDAGVFGGDAGWIGRLSGSVSVNPKTGVLKSISLGMTQSLLAGIHDGRKPQTVANGSLAFRF